MILLIATTIKLGPIITHCVQESCKLMARGNQDHLNSLFFKLKDQIKTFYSIQSPCRTLC